MTSRRGHRSDVDGGRRPSIVVLDYGSGNLPSAQRAMSHAAPDADVVISADVGLARDADALVVPGVGAFAACLAGLVGIGADQTIRERVAAGRAVLGICVGMQILFEYGDEHGHRVQGLGLLPGGVTRLTGPRVPHMGWNTVAAAPDSVLFAGAAAGERYYFVHSYAARPSADLAAAAAVSVSVHADAFVAAVERGCLAATQFHPEKSGAAGLALLGRWAEAALAVGER